MKPVKILGLALGLLFTADNMAVETPPPPQLVPTPVAASPARQPSGIIPSSPTLSAASYVLLDDATGRVLAEKEKDTRREPASLTKIMTEYVVLESLKVGKIKLSDMVTISENAWRTGGSRTFLEVGKQVPLEELLKGAVIQSGNDASVAMAEYVAGTEGGFAELMNHTAHRLGMHNSHFINATGLPHPDHYSTAYDLALLGRALIHDFPEEYKWHAEKWHTYNGIKQPNRNRLLWRDPTVDGIKTGHTDNAGYCLVSSAKRGDMRLITTVMGVNGEELRAAESQQLLSYGYRFFETKKLFGANTALSKPRVYMGTEPAVDLVVPYDVSLTLPQGQYKQVEATISVQHPLKAPIQAGQQLGVMRATLNGQVIMEAPLVADKAIPAGNLWRKMADGVKLKVQGFFNKAS